MAIFPQGFTDTDVIVMIIIIILTNEQLTNQLRKEQTDQEYFLSELILQLY